MDERGEIVEEGEKKQTGKNGKGKAG